MDLSKHIEELKIALRQEYFDGLVSKKSDCCCDFSDLLHCGCSNFPDCLGGHKVPDSTGDNKYLMNAGPRAEHCIEQTSFDGDTLMFCWLEKGHSGPHEWTSGEDIAAMYAVDLSEIVNDLLGSCGFPTKRRKPAGFTLCDN